MFGRHSPTRVQFTIIEEVGLSHFEATAGLIVAPRLFILTLRRSVTTDNFGSSASPKNVYILTFAHYLLPREQP